ncbi:ROK family protein [Micromonospora yangpuensis]|uniref:Glucokinase n=1 Tax=Micromonospora yangpuensis TaxID=683228 RepID=A0A1C6VDF2_9ACTN|nr:ROK family protein [Micromonospora yangpuensis]GGM13848.1 sugar kinase [Micromonospora yangpuensis]SCL64401.1 glucokinase [Micromonospora yangpuensis]
MAYAAGRPEDVVVALDVGGTGMKCALVRPDGTAVHTERHPTDAGRGPDAVITTILDVAEALAHRARAGGFTPVAVGLAVPGVVDSARGVAVWSANVGFRDVPLRELAEKRLGLPAALGHDVRVGALAEARLGAGRDAGHVLFVAVGTGIAGAHVVDGTAATGAHGAAGEIGHILVRPDGPPCGCGRVGCLEAIASAAAIARRYAQLSAPNGADDPARTAGAAALPGASEPTGAAGRPAVSTAEVAARAAAGEELAGWVWREAVEALADGLATGQALLDVRTIVLGGGLARAGDQLFTPLRAALRDRLTFHREPHLVPAALGDQAGCLGAALHALDALHAGGPAGSSAGAGDTLDTEQTRPSDDRQEPL